MEFFGGTINYSLLTVNGQWLKVSSSRIIRGMLRERLLRVLAVLVIGIAALHIGATVFSLYWTLWWYDWILHLLGGIFLALLVFWVRFLSGYLPAPSPPPAQRIFAFILFWTLLFGIGWEMFERLLGHTWSIEGYWLDTAIDLALDFTGGLVGFLFVVRRYPSHVG